MSDFRASLRRALVGQFGVDDAALTDDTALFSEGLLDSLTVMELVSFVEAEAGVRIPPEDIVLENFDTMACITRYVDGLAASRRGA